MPSLSITNGQKLVEDAALGSAASAIGCKLKASSIQLQSQLSLALRTKVETMDYRRDTIHTLRQNLEKAAQINEDFDALAGLEERLAEFFEQPSKEVAELQKDAIAQLSFQDTWFRCMNYVPFVLTVMSFFKIWFVPAMAIIVPVLAWLMPYVFLKYMFNLPIQQQEYFDILRNLWTGSMPSPPYGFGDDGLPTVPSLWTPRSIFQGILFIGSFAQSLIQPIMNAMHLYKTDAQFVSLGDVIVEACARGRRIQDAMRIKISPLIASFDGLDARQAFCLAQEQPERLRQIFLSLGRIEILWRLALDDRFETCMVVYKPGAQMNLEMVQDISISRAVPSHIQLSPNMAGTHAVITGPNGGGKSSALRAILQAVLFGHTYGVAAAARVEIPHFSWIASGLQLRDSPGVLSMFETEVFFASRTLQAKGGVGLILFDELFHSTNPPDANRTAELFLRAIWKREDVFSVVSTHNFGLIDDAPSNVTPLCCPAVDHGEGHIDYVYSVKKGVCKVSSVRKVWERFGLLAAAGDVGRNPTGQQEAK
jgi:hypothetical protein